VRAGTYAEYRGRTYRCGDPNLERIALFEDGSQPRPDGFGLENGDWVRRVDRGEVTRLTYVKTTAVWKGRRVDVVRVYEHDGEALIEQWDWHPPTGPTVHMVDRGLWEATVPLDALTDVVETVSNEP
jgi:hypothetical protein